MGMLSWLNIVVFLGMIWRSASSSGNVSPTFQEHLQSCLNSRCSSPSLLKRFTDARPLHLQLLGWDCRAECKYSSMWETVEEFQEQGRKIPQFYGKWPFVRFLGIQEPASTVFSLLNGFGHLYMIMKLRRTVPPNAPMYYAWHLYSAISVHAWFWSTVFHACDTTFTENMDYFSAFSLNLSGMLLICIRSLALRDGRVDYRVTSAASAVLCFIFWRHTSYLYHLPRFDYGYNMKVNLLTGLANSVWWVGWCLYHIRRKPYLIEPIKCIVAADLLLLLELGDFPPLLWTFDAHSLWHAGTFPLVFVWYRFVVADSFALLEEQDRSKVKKGV